MLRSLATLGLFIYLRQFLTRLKDLFGKYWRTTLPGLVSAVLCIYFHTEYLHWVEVTGDKTYVTISFLLKNLILAILTIKYIYIPLRKPSRGKAQNSEIVRKDEDGEAPREDKIELVFQKLRDKEKLKTAADRILKNDKDNLT